MSLVQVIGVFLPGVVMGIVVADLLWEDAAPAALLLKLFLGAGVGLGLTSLLYFLFLLAFAGKHFFIYVQLASLLLALWLALRHGRLHLRLILPKIQLKAWQIGLLLCSAVIVAFAVLGAAEEWIHRPYGTWDAFMIYDRTARFVYRGQADWMQAFSSEIDPAFHADYPLLLPLDVAQAWDALGRESQTVPRVLGSIFMLACAGLFVAALACLKSIWQALVGFVVFLNTPFFILSGASQTADVPLCFFILSTVVLICLYASQQKSGLLVLAGLTAGLAAWTKNEGDLFVVAILAGLLMAFLKQDPRHQLGYFAAGLAIPLAIVLCFKLFLAPANDILGGDTSGFIHRIFEWSRHVTILRSSRAQILAIGGTAVSVIPLLAAYGVVFGIPPLKRLKSAYLTILIMAGVQALGYYVIYLITPHPIRWQLDFSLWRVLFHMYLPLLFLLFVLVTDIQDALDFKPRLMPSESAG
jgi:hypothetical protein